MSFKVGDRVRIKSECNHAYVYEIHGKIVPVISVEGDYIRVDWSEVSKFTVGKHESRHFEKVEILFAVECDGVEEAIEAAEQLAAKFNRPFKVLKHEKVQSG